MSEKEERILIEKVETCDFGHCAGFYTEGVGEYFCVWNGERKRITENDCKNCIGISRQEAIERMAKKIDEAYIDENGCNKGLTMEELAEAALNALLEK